jgi:hypothetical protein
MLPKRGLIALAGLVLLVGPGRSQDTPQTIVARAIQAHGGMERLTRAQADRAKIKGTIFLNGKEVPFTSEILVQLPNKMKNVLQMQLEGKTHTLVQVFSGEQAHVTLDGQPQKPEASAVNEMRDKMALVRVVRLVPLLSDRSFELSLLPEIKVNDRPALGVKAEVKGRKPINLYFDKETGFLVKTEHELDDGMGKTVNEEVLYSDFRDLAGFKRPIKMVVQRKGAKVMEAEMTEVKYYDRIADAEFAKP